MFADIDVDVEYTNGCTRRPLGVLLPIKYFHKSTTPRGGGSWSIHEELEETLILVSNLSAISYSNNT